MEKLYFTRIGYNRIMNRKGELFKKLREVQAEKGNAAEVGGNQWHDNFSFEDLCRQEFVLNAQIAEINEKLNLMVVVENALNQTSQLRIGHIAVLNVDGERRVVKVGGYEDSNPVAKPSIVAYNAPLIGRLIGEEVGSEIVVDLGGKDRRIVLEKIILEVNHENGA